MKRRDNAAPATPPAEPVDPWASLWRADVAFDDDGWEIEDAQVCAMGYGLAVRDGRDLIVYPWRRVHRIRMIDLESEIERLQREDPGVISQ